MLPINPRSSFENLPPVLVDSIFSFLEGKEAQGTMPLVCSTFYGRSIALLYPNKFVDSLERQGKFLHRLPLVDYTTVQGAFRWGLEENQISHPLTRLPLTRFPFDKGVFGIILKIQMLPRTLSSEEVTRLEKRTDLIYEHFLKKHLDPASNICYLPGINSGLMIFNKGNKDSPQWKFRDLTPDKEDPLITRLVIRARSQEPVQESGVNYMTHAFTSDDFCYGLLEGILSGTDPDFKLIDI